MEKKEKQEQQQKTWLHQPSNLYAKKCMKIVSVHLKVKFSLHFELKQLEEKYWTPWGSSLNQIKINLLSNIWPDTGDSNQRAST